MQKELSLICNINKTAFSEVLHKVDQDQETYLQEKKFMLYSKTSSPGGKITPPSHDGLKQLFRWARETPFVFLGRDYTAPPQALSPAAIQQPFHPTEQPRNAEDRCPNLLFFFLPTPLFLHSLIRRCLS